MIRFALQLCFFIAVFGSQDFPQLTIEQGVLRGVYRKTWKGREFNSFTGIPYAKPPTGNLRFKPPLPAEPWKGILDASEPRDMCPQINVFLADYTVRGNEDCLHLNVYTPQLLDSNVQLLPVMFYIHGGGFFCGTGSPDLYGPDILLDKDVVLVSINYRVGALGFLSTGDEVVSGNNGLKDQNLALKWVKKNIAHFGGDPEKITVFGQSAGGASTHYHVLSPMSKDLIHGAIAHSGVATASWALGTKVEALSNAKRLAKFLNCPTSSNHDMVKCLRKVDAHEIIEQDVKFMEWHYDPPVPFKPVIEADIEGAFLTKDPIDIIKSGEVASIPFMIGVTTEEGAIKSAAIYNNSNLIETLNTDFDRIAPLALQYSENANKDDISKQIRKFYFGNRNIDTSTKSELTDLFSDAWFLAPQRAAVQLHAKYSKYPTYNYLFGYRGTSSFSPIFGDASYDYGVCHCDELLYLLSNDIIPDYNLSSSDKKFIDIMTTIWTNFAATGNPTPEINSLIRTKWEPVESNKLSYYLFEDDDNIKMDQGFHSKNMEFWKNLPTNSRTIKIRDEL